MVYFILLVEWDVTVAIPTYSGRHYINLLHENSAHSVSLLDNLDASMHFLEFGSYIWSMSEEVWMYFKCYNSI